VVRIFGIDPTEQRTQISEEELLDLVAGHAALSDEERDIVEEVFNASERQIHEVMVPRTEVDFMDASFTVGKAIGLAIDKAHSRYPVVRGSSDEVIGFIHVRDLLDTSLVTPGGKIQELVRNIIFLPGTKGILPALTEMRKKGQHLAIVRDEYDGHEQEIAYEARTNDFEIDGLTSLEDLLDDAGIEIPEGPYETASGFVMHFLGRIPVENDVVSVNGLRITVLSMDGKRAGQLLISRNA
jgi:putative hemolysin